MLKSGLQVLLSTSLFIVVVRNFQRAFCSTILRTPTKLQLTPANSRNQYRQRSLCQTKYRISISLPRSESLSHISIFSDQTIISQIAANFSLSIHLFPAQKFQHNIDSLMSRIISAANVFVPHGDSKCVSTIEHFCKA